MLKMKALTTLRTIPYYLRKVPRPGFYAWSSFWYATVGTLAVISFGTNVAELFVSRHTAHILLSIYRTTTGFVVAFAIALAWREWARVRIQRRTEKETANFPADVSFHHTDDGDTALVRTRAGELRMVTLPEGFNPHRPECFRWLLEQFLTPEQMEFASFNLLPEWELDDE